MIDCGSLEFAQARLQARHGQRADEAAWQRLEVVREFPALLDAARASPMRAWLVGITPDSASHRIEAVLRAHWRAGVAEVAAWMPAPWQPALRWCAVLPDLPVLQHLRRGGEATEWMRQDVDYRAMYEEPRAGPFGPLLALGADESTGPLTQAWFGEWQRRLPRPLGGAQDTLRQVSTLVHAHAAEFARAPPGQGWPLRRTLQARLALLLRRATLEPAAAFIHIALDALDLERLRAELLSRALFPRARAA